MREEGACADRLVAELAARQHGVVSIDQLRGAGLTDAAVTRRVRAGRLHRIHRGVYAVGHPGLTMEGRWMAAVLAFPAAVAVPQPGESRADPVLAVLSYRSAAALWELLPAADGAVDVSVPTQAGRRRRWGIRPHRCRSLLPEQTTRRRGIPVTTPARTIADLRRAVSPRELRRAIRQASVLGLPIGTEVTDGTRSELEYLFLRLCQRHTLPAPAVNARVESLMVDFLWEREKLVVETDGYRFHRGQAAFEDDRSRDLELRTRGYEVIRLSFRQVSEEPERIGRMLRKRLTPST
jgi:very-short-patch-repair endonuclease